MVLHAVHQVSFAAWPYVAATAARRRPFTAPSLCKAPAPFGAAPLRQRLASPAQNRRW